MSVQVFSTMFLKGVLGLPHSNDEIVVQDIITDVTRFGADHDIVFKYDGKYWHTSYREGNTEEQDQLPWEFQDDVECIEVEPKEVVSIQYIRVYD